ncbi:MAG: PQQ-dependent sugar dehydrogenase [Blastocatellia bacterium]|nr:PQQ-dependent sugar dehydrogenase [Blastocatellia bacterium]
MKLRLVILLVFAHLSVSAQATPVPTKVTLASGRSFTLRIAEGFEIIPAMEGLKRPRFFAKAPDDRIFVSDLYNLMDNKRGVIYILEGLNVDTGKFARAVPYMTGLRNPNSVQFHRDAEGQEWIYIAETHRLTRRKFTRAETRPTDDPPQTLATFPDYGLSYKYGGWHLTRTIAFAPNGKLYVSVGSSCNSCKEKEKVRASVIEMNPDGSEQREFARGLRNAVGMRAIGDKLYVTNQGSDHLGKNRPDETFYSLADGVDYGWPFCHSANGRLIADPSVKRRGACRDVATPFAFFPARSSALGFDFFDSDAPAANSNSFLVALHGSTDKSIGRGYKIVSLKSGARPHDFITGFLAAGKVNGRPCDVLKLDANSFLVSDDYSGIIYLVRAKGSQAAVATPTSEPQITGNFPANHEQDRACLAIVLALFAVTIASRTL